MRGEITTMLYVFSTISNIETSAFRHTEGSAEYSSPTKTVIWSSVSSYCALQTTPAYFKLCGNQTTAVVDANREWMRTTMNMATLSYMNTESLKRAPTPLFSRHEHARCIIHGCSFTRLQYFSRIMVILIQYTYLSCLKSLPINGATEWTFPGEDRRNKDFIFIDFNAWILVQIISAVEFCLLPVGGAQLKLSTQNIVHFHLAWRWRYSIMYKSHLPLVNAVTHALQKRWPQAITCIGSFRIFLQIGQVRVASSLGFRGPVLLYTVVFLISYPCVLAFVAIF